MSRNRNMDKLRKARLTGYAKGRNYDAINALARLAGGEPKHRPMKEELRAQAEDAVERFKAAGHKVRKVPAGEKTIKRKEWWEKL